ncbi:MAG: hypothetical protein IH957_05675 [Chloroflexi bacterium]|nr:hypothetical protein [Chloroflexota bacterium]
MTETRPALNDHDFMKALLNLLIPPSASRELPGAGALGLETAVAAALQDDPSLGPMVEAGALAVREAALAEHPEGLPAMAPEAGTKVVEAQLTAHPFLMMGLLRYLYPAYYQHPQVLEGIGEPPRPPFPEGFDVEATDAELLEKLLARRRT